MGDFTDLSALGNPGLKNIVIKFGCNTQLAKKSILSYIWYTYGSCYAAE